MAAVLLHGLGIGNYCHLFGICTEYHDCLPGPGVRCFCGPSESLTTLSASDSHRRRPSSPLGTSRFVGGIACLECELREASYDSGTPAAQCVREMA